MLAALCVLALAIVALQLIVGRSFRHTVGIPGSRSSQRASASARQKRAINPVSDTQFRTATEKGERFICWMADPTQAGSKATTRWKNPTSIGEWGWQLGEHTTVSAEWQPGMLKELLSGSRGGARWGYRHNFGHVPIGDMTYPPTGASYSNVYWPDKGVIVANSNYGPVYNIMTKKTPLQKAGHTWDPSTMAPPQLAQLSDFWWLLWQAACQNDAARISGIRNIVRRNVENQATLDLLGHVLKLNRMSEDGTAPEWPKKVVVDSKTDGFAALLSTPNVYAACWFVIQHGTELNVRLTIKVGPPPGWTCRVSADVG